MQRAFAEIFELRNERFERTPEIHVAEVREHRFCVWGATRPSSLCRGNADLFAVAAIGSFAINCCMSFNFKLSCLSASVLLGFSSSADAQHGSSADAPCRTRVSTSDAVECLNSAAKKADAELNKTYGTILKFLPPDVRQSVVNAQRLWLRYRDASCAAERSLYGNGTASGPVYLACVEAATRQQTASLREAYWWRVEKFSN